ncbi:Protein of unknown function [Gryllus bimaculatus]|nr:Protein of unknown function [Gryllus bimaculatus]
MYKELEWEGVPLGSSVTNESSCLFPAFARAYLDEKSAAAEDESAATTDGVPEITDEEAKAEGEAGEGEAAEGEEGEKEEEEEGEARESLQQVKARPTKPIEVGAGEARAGRDTAVKASGGRAGDGLSASRLGSGEAGAERTRAGRAGSDLPAAGKVGAGEAVGEPVAAGRWGPRQAEDGQRQFGTGQVSAGKASDPQASVKPIGPGKVGPRSTSSGPVGADIEGSKVPKEVGKGKSMITLYDDEEEKRRLSELETADKEGRERLNKELARAEKLKHEADESHKSLRHANRWGRDAVQKINNDILDLRQEVSNLDASNKAFIDKIKDDLLAEQLDVPGPPRELEEAPAERAVPPAKPKLVQA